MTEAFTGIFSAALKHLCCTMDPVDLQVLLFLCAHADGAGRCRPGVKYIGQSLDLRFEEVRYRLDRLERQSLFRYLRRNARDELTGEFLPDVYAINPRILLTKIPVPHPAENAEQAPVPHSAENAEPVQFRIAPVQPSQPESEPEELNQNQGTRIRNQHQQPEEFPTYGKKPVTGASSIPGSAPSYAWGEESNAKAQTQATGSPAPAGTKPAPAGHVEDNTPPSSAPPPIQPMIRYVNALEDAHLEALANEVKAIAPTRLYNARELVMRYGEVNIRKGLVQLEAAKAKGSVYNPMGLLTTWLRTGALKAEPVADSLGMSYVSGKYADFIES